VTADVSLPDRFPGEAEPDVGTRDSLRADGTEMAVAGFVLSVLWLFFLGSIAGLWLGVAARRQLAVEGSPDGPSPAHWAGKLAIAAIVIGGVGVVFAFVIAALQVSGLVNITAACHPAVTGITCRLVVH